MSSSESKIEVDITPEKDSTLIRTSIESPQFLSLTRKLLLQNHPNQRINNDAIGAASKLLQIFISEAINRAATEAQCDEVQSQNVGNDTSNRTTNTDDNVIDNVTTVREEHVLKIAIELLMTFS